MMGSLRMLHSPARRICFLGLSSNNASFEGWGYVIQKKFKHGSHHHQIPNKIDLNKLSIIVGTIAASWCLYYSVNGKKRSVLSAASKDPCKDSGAPKTGEINPNLPYYTIKEVGDHCTKKDGIWVTFGQGVYNITEFVDEHPGGDRILMAAGGALEPFWILYGVHKTPNTLSILEKYRIGNISLEEASKLAVDMDDPYGLDPRRHPALRPSSVKPFNAEPPPSILVDSFLTPIDLFYVRNHLPVPDVDPKTYKLEVNGVGIKPLTFSLDELKRFPKYTITAAIQCAGNRRSEMSKVRPVRGLNWGPATIGNATWSGARLVDVLAAAGLTTDTPGVQHVHLEGLDEYAASVPAETALDPRSDVLLAYEMNGQTLSRDHGFPVRAIVPGVVGARNVKWLGDIVLSESESTSHWQQGDYKGFSPSVDWDTVDFSKSPAIQVLPVTSAICQPENGERVRVKNGAISIKGYAWSGGGQKIVRVDVTCDGGKSWHVAEFTDQDGSKTPRHWAWTLWQAEVPVAANAKEVEIWCKAVDASYNTQPESFENIWNLRGVLSNAYHRVYSVQCGLLCRESSSMIWLGEFWPYSRPCQVGSSDLSSWWPCLLPSGQFDKEIFGTGSKRIRS